MVEELTQEQIDYLNDLEKLKNDYVNLFATAEGKRVLADLEKLCYQHKTTFTGEADTTIFNEGLRAVLLHIQNRQKIDIEKTKELLKKQGKEQES